MPGAAFYQHVDGLFQKQTAESADACECSALHVGLRASAALRRHHITISSGTVVVGSRLSVARRWPAGSVVPCVGRSFLPFLLKIRAIKLLLGFAALAQLRPPAVAKP